MLGIRHSSLIHPSYGLADGLVVRALIWIYTGWIGAEGLHVWFLVMSVGWFHILWGLPSVLDEMCDSLCLEGDTTSSETSRVCWVRCVIPYDVSEASQVGWMRCVIACDVSEASRVGWMRCVIPCEMSEASRVGWMRCVIPCDIWKR